MPPRLAQVIARVFSVAPETVTPDSGPHTIAKWDSAGHMSLLAAVEKEYGVQFNDDEVVELVSAEAVAEALARHGAQP
jgi:acyl carrier protein